MRDAGHQLADGRQPLAVDQLLPQAALLRDVTLDRDEMRGFAARVSQRDHGGRDREARSVGAGARHRPAPGASAPHRLLDVLRRNRVVGHQLPRPPGHELFTRAVHGAAERIVGVAAAAVRRHDQDQILRLLDHLRQQPHRRAGLLELGALRGDAREEQRQHRDDRDRRGEIAEAGDRFVGRDAAEAVVEERQQRDRREDHPRPRP